ncbi:MAG: ribosome biogenesis GTP-binding protein YihA/YsxC [Pseudomonadota bacterium]
MADAPSFQFTLDPDHEPETVEAGRLLFTREPRFVIGCARLDQLPPGDRVEICFAGRSNVGKSTLINALLGRKGVARASNTPGRTQQLNYFDLDERLYLVDLPGYGFAQAPKKTVEAWQTLLKAYLAGRASLRRVFCLIDARHGVKPVDHEIMDLLDRAAVGFQLVLTKADKPAAKDLAKTIAQVQEQARRHVAAHPAIRITSSETGRGLEGLRADVAELLTA